MDAEEEAVTNLLQSLTKWFLRYFTNKQFRHEHPVKIQEQLKTISSWTPFQLRREICNLNTYIRDLGKWILLLVNDNHSAVMMVDSFLYSCYRDIAFNLFKNPFLLVTPRGAPPVVVTPEKSSQIIEIIETVVKENVMQIRPATRSLEFQIDTPKSTIDLSSPFSRPRPSLTIDIPPYNANLAVASVESSESECSSTSSSSNSAREEVEAENEREVEVEVEVETENENENENEKQEEEEVEDVEINSEDDSDTDTDTETATTPEKVKEEVSVVVVPPVAETVPHVPTPKFEITDALPYSVRHEGDDVDKPDVEISPEDLADFLARTMKKKGGKNTTATAKAKAKAKAKKKEKDKPLKIHLIDDWVYNADGTRTTRPDDHYYRFQTT